MKGTDKITKRHYLPPSLFALFFLIGASGILTVISAVKSKVASLGYTLDVPPVFYDDFTLFKNVSLAICGFLFVLTTISVLTEAVLRKNSSGFTKLVALISPYICGALLVCIGIFYAYLTSGGEHSITPAVIALSIFEALTFALPLSVHGFISLAAKKSKGKQDQ